MRDKFPYTTPSTVKEVSAILVATMNRLQFGGGGLKTRTCRINQKKWCIINATTCRNFDSRLQLEKENVLLIKQKIQVNECST